MTKGICRSPRNLSVRSRFFSLNHEALRNSTAPVRPASRAGRPPLDLVAVLGRGEEPARVLEQDRAELPGLRERLEAVGEPRPDVVAERVGQVLGVDPRLGGDLRRQGRPQVLRQPPGLGRLAGHQGVRLDVEDEVGRRPLDPELGRPARGERVVRRVDLDEREPAGVVRQPLLGRVGAVGVEDAGRGHRRVRPGRRADPDRAGTRADRLGRDVRREVLHALGARVGSGVVDRVAHPFMVRVDADRFRQLRGIRTAATRPRGRSRTRLA